MTIRDMVQVHSPEVALRQEEFSDLAVRSGVLDRAHLAIIENGKPNARRLLEALVEALGNDLSVEKVSVWSHASLTPLADDELEVLANEVDVVLCGVGDCAGCSSCSLYDAIRLERRGIPTATIVSDVFQGLSAEFAFTFGMPSYKPVTVPHPVSTRDQAWLETKAKDIAPYVARVLTEIDVSERVA